MASVVSLTKELPGFLSCSSLVNLSFVSHCFVGKVIQRGGGEGIKKEVNKKSNFVQQQD